MGENEITTDLLLTLWDVVKDVAKLVPSNAGFTKLELAFYDVMNVEKVKTKLGGIWCKWKSENEERWWFTQNIIDYMQHLEIQITLYAANKRHEELG